MAQANEEREKKIRATQLRRAATLAKQRCQQEQNPRACYHQATLYKQGQGVAKDPAKSEALFRKACAMGDGLACARSEGFIKRSGDSAKLQAAIKRSQDLLTEACKGKDRSACYELSRRATTGPRALRSKTEAAKYLQTACELDHGEACYELATRKRHKDATQGLADYHHTLEQSCKLGVMRACRALNTQWKRLTKSTL